MREHTFANELDYHQQLLCAAQEARLAGQVVAAKPNAWDHISLHLGEWLIQRGKNLKARSIFTHLAERHA